MTSTTVEVGDVDIVVDEWAGEGDTVTLLHGFPDTARLWREIGPRLAAAGHRVLAPDLRGFGRSSRPDDVRAYRMSHAVADLVAVWDALGVDATHVVGHDFGSVLGWHLAATDDRVCTLAALSAPHPAVFRDLPLEQRRMWWYMYLFLLDGVAEDALRRDDWRLFREMCEGADDVDAYIGDLARPGALTASLRWYRANVPMPVPGPSPVPVLAALGEHDPYLVPSLMDAAEAHAPAGWRRLTVAGAGHWLPLDAADELVPALQELFRQEGS